MYSEYGVTYSQFCLMFYNGPLEAARDKFEEEWTYEDF